MPCHSRLPVLLAAAVVLPCQARLPLSSDSTYGVAAYDMFRGAVLANTGLYGRSEYDLALGPNVSLVGRHQSYYTIDSGVHDAEGRYSAGARWTSSAWPLALEAAVAYYSRLRWVGPTTWEAKCGLSYGRRTRLVLEGAYDLDRNVGFYLDAGVRHPLRVGSRAELQLTGDVGLDFGRGIDGFNDAALGAYLDLRLTPRWSVRPALELLIPSARVASYGARLVPSLGIGYHHHW
ncbi:MAG: hypothetical protein HYU66_20625 [Armatimonadetes bacterium]|nr:hypothetical protein [Armatimonadota bacterium]